jgi:hypothetical protein
VDSTTALGLAANVVALVLVAAGWRQNHDTLENQRRIADLGHVRGLLDDAAVALHRAAYVLDEVRSGMTKHSPNFFTSEPGTEVFADLDAEGKKLDALVERLRVRFGNEHPVVVAFRQADEAMLDIYRAAGLVRLEDPPDGSPLRVTLYRTSTRRSGSGWKRSANASTRGGTPSSPPPMPSRARTSTTGRVAEWRRQQLAAARIARRSRTSSANSV